ncbi:hypothetical protein SISNIDRAFT_252323 [Sistotremastrum niveocremeum HHB9708]|uniref:DUF7881 domain-containing protein n=1 Tax=Sistotremastrum niveocremeum HHB9708 TaxID=1314777 RepID=A0A164Z1Y4_9AGAM|nr:hypothetical protein SISNIDRAFT_252323 [Sistotremastrum niveocremeum HHB9708]
MPNSRDEEYDIWRAAASHLDDDDSDDDADIGSYHDRRNILIFDKNDSLIAGLEQRGTFTVANIYRWLSILYPLPNIWFLQSKTNAGIIPRESHAILPLGSYQIVDAGTCYSSDHAASALS